MLAQPTSRPTGVVSRVISLDGYILRLVYLTMMTSELNQFQQQLMSLLILKICHANLLCRTRYINNAMHTIATTIAFEWVDSNGR
jgi:hypothetical protein